MPAWERGGCSQAMRPQSPDSQQPAQQGGAQRNFGVSHGWLTPRFATSGSLTSSLSKSYSLLVPPQASGTQQTRPFLGQHTTVRLKQPLPQTSTHIHSLPSPPLDTQGQYLLSRSFFPIGSRILLAYYRLQPLGAESTLSCLDSVAQ